MLSSVFAADRPACYARVLERIDALLDGENDWIAAMATVACELHETFAYFHWTGFYRVAAPEMLVIGPYQGGHGCLRVPFGRGVCGVAARDGATMLVEDVALFSNHIACSSSTRSEIVVPVITPDGDLLAVLDVDSDDLSAFNDTDRRFLEQLCTRLGAQFRHASNQ